MKMNLKFTIAIILSIALPIAVLAGVLFYNMEQDTVQENCNYMEYKMNRNESQVVTNMDSINMSTQFFLSDEKLLNVLIQASEGESMSTQEILDFYETDVASLERLVNNNPLLYSVRVYAENDHVQEMMPVLYNKSRLEKMAWASEGQLAGWHFGYYDTAFSALMTNQEEPLLSLVTPVMDYKNGCVGVIEASMTMDTMFPSLNEEIENEWSCFVQDDGSVYFGTNEKENSRELLEQIRKQHTDMTEKTVEYIQSGDVKLVVTCLPVSDMGGTLISVQDVTGDVNHVYFMRNTFVLVMIVVLFLLTFVIDQIVKRMLRQFYVILKDIRLVQKGNLDVRIENCGNDEMGELGNQFNKMLDRIQKLMKDNIDREILVKNSEIRALQNQINAHFIYNVLESIKMMAEIDEEYAISDAITSLGKLLRYSMKWVSGNVTLYEELEYIKNYLALINLRYDFEIRLSLNLPDVLMNQEIPKMSLQPVVENAILHGIDPVAENTTIYIKGWEEEKDCIIEVTDMGQGMTEEELTVVREKIAGKVETEGGKGNGIGLKNVQDRIQIHFGKPYGLSFASKKGCYTKVAVRLPRKNGTRMQMTAGIKERET